MKVVNLEVENFMGVKAVEITPDGPVITIGGKNGQGKSSILNAMISALAGAKELPGVAVRDGEESAVTRVVLSRPEGDLHITRTVKSDGKTTLTVKSADGAKYGKPQQLLDALVGAVGFDPHEFTRLDAKKQAERLRQLVGLDTSSIDTERDGLYSRRTDVNREVKQLSARVESLPHHGDAPESEVSVSELMEELRSAQEVHRQSEDAARLVAVVLDEAQSAIENVERLEQQLKYARAEIVACEVKLERFRAEAAAAKAKSDALDLESIGDRVQRADADNRKVRENAERKKVAAELAARQADADMLTKEIAGLDEEKAMAMAAAKWPVEGLGFDDSGVTYNGRPFGQASSAEQLRVSLAMGMALNPQLKVLVIRDGSLIDDETMAVIRGAVAEKDFQLWVEKVSASGEGCTVLIEDGSVAS